MHKVQHNMVPSNTAVCMSSRCVVSCDLRPLHHAGIWTEFPTLLNGRSHFVEWAGYNTNQQGMTGDIAQQWLCTGLCSVGLIVHAFEQWSKSILFRQIFLKD